MNCVSEMCYSASQIWQNSVLCVKAETKWEDRKKSCTRKIQRTGNNTKSPKVTGQNQHFKIPWDLFDLTTQERACWNKLKAFVKTRKVTGGTIHLSHSVDQSDFFTTSRHQCRASYWCPDVCRRPVASRDASQRLAKLFPTDPNLSRLSSVYSLMEPPVCCVQLHLYTVLIGPGGLGGPQHMFQCIVISHDCSRLFHPQEKHLSPCLFFRLLRGELCSGNTSSADTSIVWGIYFLLFTRHIKSCLLFRRLFKAASIDPHVTFCVVSVCFCHSATVRLDTVRFVRFVSFRSPPTAGELSVSAMDVRFIRGRKPCRLGGSSPSVGVTLIVIMWYSRHTSPQ